MISRIGIVGGGQLGKMLAQSAKQLGFTVSIIDPTPNSPAGQVCDRQIVADYKDEKAIRELAKVSDVITFEIELANDKVLHDLIKKGKIVHPSPKTLSIIRDKFLQKRFLQKHHIPTAEFVMVTTKKDILRVAAQFGYPFLLKARTDAYDGRGNAVIHTEHEIDSGLEKLSGRALYIERFVPFVKELAVVVARSPKNEIKVYPVVQTYHLNNICDVVIAPARISSEVATRAQRLAKKTMDKLKGAGVFGIEMFMTKNGQVLINEIAPRVHNSGHFTIEGCETSQFEQHIRAITGLPLGSVAMRSKASVMKNILGTKDGDGFPVGLENALKIPGVSVHMYGKQKARLNRKMGHITVVGKTVEECLKKATQAREGVRI